MPAAKATPELLQDAVEALGGAVLVLDKALRVVAATPLAERLLGVTVKPGILAPKLLCGQAQERPVAEALEAGRPVVAAVPWPGTGGRMRMLAVRATPMEAAGELRGWLLLLRQEAGEETDSHGPLLFQGLWTQDVGMKRLFRVLQKAAASSANVLVREETGSGKELVARAVHALSPRRSGPFRALNCAALPATLLESELFGHERGSFTGAVRDYPGHFRLAAGGTLFLDEVAELPLELQAKLLRVVETRSVIPVGGRDPIEVDVRLVAATHRSLRQAVEAGRFRADLMYRLRVVPLFLPPLRDRPGDALLLAEKMIDTLNRMGGRQVERLGPSVIRAFERYSWPGNVRELRNVLEYAFVVGEGPVLVDADLPPELLDPEEREDHPPAVNRPPVLGSDGEPEAELAAIRRALERTKGNRDRAARLLGMSRSTLWRRIKALGLDT